MNMKDVIYISVNSQGDTHRERYLNPEDIYIDPGYKIEVFAQGLDSPVNLVFTDEGTMLIAESGEGSGNARVLKLVNSNFDIMADGFKSPLTGINYLNGILYVSQKGFITRVSPNGVKQNIITGLPSNGDFYNGKVVFRNDNKLYFGQGTVTNSGVVGQDNLWINQFPYCCDYAGDYIILYGQNYQTQNFTNEYNPNEVILTGAYSPFGVPNTINEVKKGYLKASGSILRSNLDGTNLELYAWGLRNPLNIKFDYNGQLFVSNIGFDNRGSRPIANAPDEFYAVTQNQWYGWPDYSGGEPITLQKFKPLYGEQPTFIIKNHPNPPIMPYVTFPTNSNIMGFDFDYDNFSPKGDVYIAEYGSMEIYEGRELISYAGTGHRISKIDMQLHTVSTFALNKSGFPSSITKEGGFGRPVDILFGPDKAMYVVDQGLNDPNNPTIILPNTGVIWRVTKI